MNDIFKNRRSVREFTDKEVSEEQIKEILNSAMVAPSGMHKQPWDLIVVKDRNILKKLGSIGMWQKFVSKSSVSIVIVGNPSESDLWLQDCSLVAGHIYLESTNQGLGSCWANVYDDEKKENIVRKALDIPSDKRVLCIMAIGYPKKKGIPHTESDFIEEKVHRDKW
jgi:nitroreductase